MSVKFLNQHPAVGVSCIDQAKQFYGELLGFHLDWEWGEPVFHLSFSQGEVIFHVTTLHEGVGKSNLYFVVDDVQAYYEEVIARGAKADSAPVVQPYGMIDFHVKDPDGNIIGFGQMGESAPTE